MSKLDRAVTAFGIGAVGATVGAIIGLIGGPAGVLIGALVGFGVTAALGWFFGPGSGGRSSGGDAPMYDQ